MSESITDWMWTRDTGSGHVAHKIVEGTPVPFWSVPLPTGVRGLLFRLLHRCIPQSKGVFGWEVTERCPCGAVRFADLPPTQPRGGIPTVAYQAGPWLDRNNRFTGDAWAYQGGIRLIDSTKGGV
jgi:hypothetical protein